MFNKKGKILKELEKEYDSIGYISPALKKELKLLYSNEEYAIGIHRTGCLNPSSTSDYLYDVFYNGLINNGNVSLGIGDDESKRNLAKTVSFINNPVVLHGQIKAAPQYKQSSGVIIIKIPKAYLERTNKPAKPIYFPTNNGNVLLREFIYGYVPVTKDYIVGDLIKNPNYTDVHDYRDDDLIYELGVNSNDDKSFRR